jgi:opacity protein-like surface antigen
MKKFALGLVAAVVLSGAAIAADPMQTRFDNTITLTAPDGAVTKVNFNRDGTMSTVAPDGTKVTGKWAMKDGKLCVTLDAGPTAGKEGCNPFVERKPGDTWEVTLADGSKAKATMVAGR